MLELLHFCAVYGFEETEYSWDDVGKYCTTNFSFNPIYAELEDVYAITHSILYSYNFGVELSLFPFVINNPDLPKILDSIILIYCSVENYDVLCELVATSVLIGDTDARIISFAVKKIVLAIEHLLSSPIRPNFKDEISENEKISKYVLSWYHTIMVANYALRLLIAKNFPFSNLESEVEQVIKNLSNILASLNAYELSSAFYLMRQTEYPSFLNFESIWRAIIGYIESQKTVDGRYGIFVDEAHLHELDQPSIGKEEFNKMIAFPLSRGIEETLRSLKQVHGHIWKPGRG